MVLGLEVLALLASVAVLGISADFFVRRAGALARRLGLAPLVVGIVVIGYGTSLPELVTASFAAARGSLGVALGSVVGSNVFNLTVVAGLAGLLRPAPVAPPLLRREAPLTLAVVGVVAAALRWADGRLVGVGLLVMLAGVSVWLVWLSKRAEGAGLGGALGPEVEDFVAAESRKSPWRLGAWVALGLAGTLGSAQGFVWASLKVAAAAGVGQGGVGLLIVAIGTSLPELTTGLAAARHGEPELVVGNVLGSDTFNSLGVAGASWLIDPNRAPGSVAGWPDLVMVVVMGVFFFFIWSGRRLARSEAGLLVLCYGAMAWLSLR